MEKITIYCDGGARGNPGPAGVGVVIQNENIFEISKFIGTATNNQAEYRAVIEALKWLTNKPTFTSGVKVVEFLLDSKLVVEQLNGRYKIKNEGLKLLFWQIRDLMIKLGGNISFQYIPREQNNEADKLVNLAIDKAIK